MQTPCPRCGCGTAIEDELGDFPMRCQRCGALLRRRAHGEGLEVEEQAGRAVSAATTIRRGGLAGMLQRTPQEEAAAVATHVATSEAHRAGVLRPESRREIARAHARQQALERARLRGSHQALGALTWAGLILAILLGVGAAVLKAHAWWQHPSSAHADVVRVQ